MTVSERRKVAKEIMAHYMAGLDELQKLSSIKPGSPEAMQIVSKSAAVSAALNEWVEAHPRYIVPTLR